MLKSFPGNSQFNLFLLALASFLLSSSAEATTISYTNWRFFNASDGMGESGASYVTLGSDGRIWVAHGMEDKLSWLDGWPTTDGKFVRTLPSPGEDLKVYESCSGQLWSLYANGIQLFSGGKWIRYQIDEINVSFSADIQFRTVIPFLPGGQDQVYYLLPDRLMMFNAANGKKENVKRAVEANIGRFIDMIAARDGGIWITGQKGIAKLSPVSESPAWKWSEHLLDNLGVENFRAPIESVNKELFLIGVDQRLKKRVLINFDGAKGQVIRDYAGEVVRGWSDLEGNIWIWKERNSLFLLRNGRKEVQENVEILSGDFHDVAVEPNGVFWLTTSHGLARYAPSIWRTQPEVQKIKERVHAIHEDAKGGLWFAAVHNLIRFQDGQWEIFPLPGKLETQTFFTQSVCSLPDGRIAIGTIPYHNFLLTFHPKTEQFEIVPHLVRDSLGISSSRFVGLIAPRRDGTIWVQTLTQVDSMDFRLEIFDGKTFIPFLDLGRNWDIGNLRYLLETENGDLWIGGQKNRGLALYRNGKYKNFNVDKDYAGSGVFCLYEAEGGKIWIGGRDDILEYDGRHWSVMLSNLSSVRSIITSRYSGILAVSGTGIHRYVNGSWVTNTIEDGLPNTAAFSILEDSRGRLWAGTISGLSLYHLEADTDPPQTIISAAKNLAETPPDGEVRLIFSGLDKWKQIRADRLLFSYRLDDSDWTPFKTGNVAIFNKLPYGKHHFELRAMDSNMNYTPELASFDFTVLLPWYKETGFQIVALIGGIVIIFLIGFATYRHIAQEKLVTQRTRDLQQANITLKNKHSKLESMLMDKSFLVEIASNLNSTLSTIEDIIRVMRLIHEKMEIDLLFIFDIVQENENVFYPSLFLSPDKVLTYQEIPSRFYTFSSELLHQLKQYGIFVFSRSCQSPGYHSDYFAEQTFESACLFPRLRLKKGIIGLIGFGKIKSCEWKPDEYELLKAAAHMIGNAWNIYQEFYGRLEAEKKQAEALQMAEKASRMAAIGVMAAGIIHEINQPLNVIRITADSIVLWDEDNNSILPQKFRERMIKLSQSVTKIDEIIQHMRSFWVSPEHILPETFDLNEGINNALSLIDRQLSAHGIELAIERADSPLLIRGNRIHLEQIIINLVINSIYALDATTRKDKKIIIRSHQENNIALVEVQDNGIGLPQGAENDIFDPFFSTRKPGEGTGLGLAIVKRFTERMGGTIEARNNDLGGATFTLRLSIKQTE
ncbi:MAG TPA: ATP-binding protein [archaeon]|nr:ATP-binding protein [archaeon]